MEFSKLIYRIIICLRLVLAVVIMTFCVFTGMVCTYPDPAGGLAGMGVGIVLVLVTSRDFFD